MLNLWFFYLASDEWFFFRFLRNWASETFAHIMIFRWVWLSIRYVGWKMASWLPWPKAALLTCLWIYTLLYIIWILPQLFFVLFAVSHGIMKTLLLIVKARWLSWKSHIFTFIWTAFLAVFAQPRVLPGCTCILCFIGFNTIFLNIIILVLHRLNEILVDAIFSVVFSSRLHLRQRWLFCYWFFIGEVIIYIFDSPIE